MASGAKFTIDEVREFIKNNTECKLLSTEYNGIYEQLLLKCSCGDTFKTKFSLIKYRNIDKCQKCRGMGVKKIPLKLTIEYVKQKFIDMGLIPLFDKYSNNREELKCTTQEGYLMGVSFKQINQGSYPKIISKHTTDSIFNLKIWLKLNTDNYELLSDKYISNQSKLLFKCNKGHEFLTTWNTISAGHRCPECNNSKGELKIKQWLDSNNITHASEYTFDNLVNPNTKGKLRFDFAIFNKTNKLSMLIEYQGQQHYEPVDFSGHNQERANKEFKELQYRDNLKVKYCKQNNIPLLRIKYTEFSFLEDILAKEIPRGDCGV